MIPSRTIFEERKSEVALYFQLLVDIVDRDASLVFPLSRISPVGASREERPIAKELSHTLKANGFLLLYNLVEASMTAAFEDIHLQIESEEGLGADDLIECLANRAMKRFKNGALIDGPFFENSASASILKYWLEDHRKRSSQQNGALFSGNLDARMIREIAKDYGISTKTNLQSDGRFLSKVRKSRNELAHGALGFRDCGREVSLPELEEIRADVVDHLDGVISNIEEYLVNRKYRRA